MQLPDSEREIIDPPQAEQDAVIAAFVEQNPTDLQRRRDELAAIQQIHRAAHAYNKACYAVGSGAEIDDDPRVVSERQWRVSLKLAATFIRCEGRMSPAQVRHEWAIEMSRGDTLHYLPTDVLVPFEDLPAQKQLEEQAGVQAMRVAMSPPLIVEDHTQLTDAQLLHLVHSADDQIASIELARRRALRSIGQMEAN